MARPSHVLLAETLHASWGLGNRGLDNLHGSCTVSNTLDTDTLTQERKKVLDLYHSGWSVREIAEALHVSTQRVYQQLEKLKLPSPSKKADS